MTQGRVTPPPNAYLEQLLQTISVVVIRDLLWWIPLPLNKHFRIASSISPAVFTRSPFSFLVNSEYISDGWEDLWQFYRVSHQGISITRLCDFKYEVLRSNCLGFEMVWFDENRFLILIDPNENSGTYQLFDSTRQCVCVPQEEPDKLEIHLLSSIL